MLKRIFGGLNAVPRWLLTVWILAGPFLGFLLRELIKDRFFGSANNWLDEKLGPAISVAASGALLLLWMALFGASLLLVWWLTKITAESSGTEINPSGIEKEFAAIAKRYGSELGELVRGPKKSSILYQAFHEHADFIWSHETREIEVLYRDNKNTRVSLPERSSSPYEDEWYVDRRLREKFPETPANLYPPFGGIAVFWKEGNPSERKAVQRAGYRKAHCAYYDTAYFWQFQNGFVFGPIRDNPTPHDQPGQFLIFLDQKPRRYVSLGTHLRPAECQPPRLRPGLEN